MNPTKGFTLLELLVVIVVLGLLAAVVVPGLTGATGNARGSSLAESLRVMRGQIIVFKNQHRHVSPGYPNGDMTATPTEEAFAAHMTQASNHNFQTAPPRTAGYTFGPYMMKIPRNPINEKTTVQIIANDGTVPGTGDDSHGWIYQPSTVTFRADSAGEDESGRAYFEY